MPLPYTRKYAESAGKKLQKYRREHPGSHIRAAVTSKHPSNADKKRRKSFCARSKGQMAKFPNAAHNPMSRLRQARRRWRC